MTATRGTLVWPGDVDEPMSFALPKKGGGIQTYTWHYSGTQTGRLLGVEVQFLRKSSYFPPMVSASCTP